MAPTSVLGKRSGPVENSESSFFDSGLMFSPATNISVGSVPTSASTSVSFSGSDTSGSESSSLDPNVLRMGNPRAAECINNIPVNGTPSMCYWPSDNSPYSRQPQYQQVYGLQQPNYGLYPQGHNVYPLKQHQMPQVAQQPPPQQMYFPQSPPKEPFMDEYGEKRRKVQLAYHQGQASHQIPQQLMPFPQQQPQPYHLNAQQQLHGIPNAAAVLQPAPPLVTKPPVTPSLVVPQIQPAAATVASVIRPAAPLVPLAPLRNFKPQNITLPKVIDGIVREDCDTKDGHYDVVPGERFAGRYVIVKLLGQGTFGKVAQAFDERTQDYCAIKIIRAIPKYRDASKIELRVLTLLSSCDPHQLTRCVRMRECFDYRDHVCIVTDLYDISVYDFLKENAFMPFPGTHIKHFAKQLLSSIAHIHALGIVHTDLKPENILLTSSDSVMGTYRRISNSNSVPRARRAPRKELRCTDITLIDFGSAVFEDEYHSAVVSTRHYRAPEIVFGTGWSYSCDMWSVGCVLVELCTGRVLFETRDNLEHLHMMENALGGKFSTQQLTSAAATSEAASLVSTRGWYPKLRPLASETQVDAVRHMRSISELIKLYTSSRERYFWDGFQDLVNKLMTLDPQQRLTAAEALQHPWLN